MELSKTVLIQVIIMFILMMLGLILKKAKVFDDRGTKQMSSLLVTIVSPSVVIDALSSAEYSPAMLSKLGIAFLLSVSAHIIGILITLLFYRGSDSKSTINKACSVYTNCGFMGIPLFTALEAIFPGCLFFGTAYLATFNIVIWTHGVYIYTKKNFRFSIKNLIINPGIIGVSIGIILYLTRIEMPYVVTSVVKNVALLNTPLAMILLGAYLAKVDYKTVFKNIHLYIVSFLKLLLIPMVCSFLMMLLKIDNSIWLAIVVAAACPSATIGAIFAEKYNMDTAYASQIIAVTTLFSIGTIPIVVSLTNLLMQGAAV